MRDKILKWLLTGETGLSSRTMARCFSDIGFQDIHADHPWDPADFNRCLGFLKAVPEARKEMKRLKALSIEWSFLVDRWEEIEKSFNEEMALWDIGKSSGKTYKLIEQAIKDARNFNKEKES